MKEIADGFANRFPLIYSLVTERRKLTLMLFAVAFMVITYGYFALLLITADGLFVSLGPMIGGDFIVFRTAAEAVGTPKMVSIYQMDNLAAMLRYAYPGHGDMMVGWQYPPTMYLVVSPFALVPFVAAYCLWLGAFGTLFVSTLRTITADRSALILALGSPAVLQAVITGQTGLLTASLIACSGAFATSRPLLAGVAAGILTVKPQFGLLIPIAFVAAGCWRAFAVAAVTGVALVVASVGAFGLAPWLAFFEAVTAHGDRLGAMSGFPLEKLMTPFGGARVLGASSSIAAGVQLAATIAMAGYVAVVWRQVKAFDLRLAALATASVLATPYGFYYEMVILVPPMLLIALRASKDGWLKGEQLSLIIVWVGALLTPGARDFPAFPTSFAVTLLAFAIAARRTLQPQALHLASSAPRAI